MRPIRSKFIYVSVHCCTVLFTLRTVEGSSILAAAALPPFSFSPATTFRAMLLFDIGIGVTHSFFFGVKSHHITIDFVLYHIFRYFLSVIISFALNIKWNFTFGFFVCIVQRLKIRVGQRFVDRASFTWVKDQHSFQETHGLFIAPPKQFGKRSSLSFGKLKKTGPFFQKRKQKKEQQKSQPRHHHKGTTPLPPPYHRHIPA